MSSFTDNIILKIEPGQIFNNRNFPLANELVCVQVPKVFDQVSLRECETRDVVLIPHLGACCTKFVFEKAQDFDIMEVKVLSKTDLHRKTGYKKLKLSVKIKYNIFFSDGVNHLIQQDEVTFNLLINKMYCPNCSTQIGVIRHPNNLSYPSNAVLDADGLLIKVEAFVDVFNHMICACTGALILQIGAFFVVSCERNVQLLIPSYGYCHVPPEQRNPSMLNCNTFLDRTKIPFPLQLFSEQRWNPIDFR